MHCLVQVSEAYEVLEDDSKRQKYDQFGHAGVDENMGAPNGPGGGPFGGFSYGFHTNGSIDIEDLFEMFGSSMGGAAIPRPVEARVQIGFFEAVNGCSKEITFEYFVREQKRNTIQKIRKSKTVTIDIPAGIASGMTMRAQGKGAENPSKPAGDLLVTVDVTPDPYFVRKNNDVHVEIPISITQVIFVLVRIIASEILCKAILGSSVDVLTLGGIVEMKVPPGVLFQFCLFK